MLDCGSYQACRRGPGRGSALQRGHGHKPVWVISSSEGQNGPYGGQRKVREELLQHHELCEREPRYVPHIVLLVFTNLPGGGEGKRGDSGDRSSEGDRERV